MGGHGVEGAAAVDDDGGTHDGYGCGLPSSARADHDHVTEEVGGVVRVLPRDVLAQGCS